MTICGRIFRGRERDASGFLLRLQESLDVASGGHRRLRPSSRNRNCGNRRRVPSSLHRRCSSQKAHSKSRVERVASCSRVHRFHGKGRNHLTSSSACGQKNTLRTHLDHNVLRPTFQKQIRAARSRSRSNRLIRAKAAENARLALIWRNPSGALQQTLGKLASRGGIQHQRNFVLVRKNRQRLHGY